MYGLEAEGCGLRREQSDRVVRADSILGYISPDTGMAFGNDGFPAMWRLHSEAAPPRGVRGGAKLIYWSSLMVSISVHSGVVLYALTHTLLPTPQPSIGAMPPVSIEVVSVQAPRTPEQHPAEPVAATTSARAGGSAPEKEAAQPQSDTADDEAAPAGATPVANHDAVLQLDAGEIRFEQVDFSYQPERAILHKVDFTIVAGEKLAVVGHSGAGKSTLSRLLFRFYDVTNGSIMIDGQDIRHITRSSLRSAIGIVPQDTVLFNDTILYNLAYGRPDATQEEIEAAARIAHITEFITQLPEGYQTVVGERGLKLSGGEKQRVAIARAMLKRPRILVFDEATSSLDSKTEQAIQETLGEVAKHHTTLVIAHRLSTVVDADRILVMEGGRIVEQGTHLDLLEQQGLYHQMWQLQQKERQALEIIPTADALT